MRWRPGRPPGLKHLTGYDRALLPGDAVAGLLVAALAIPQSLGYAAVAGVPIQVGLYTLPPALLAYALFGTSRVLFVGPISTVAVLSGSLVRGLSQGNQQVAVELTSILAIVAGIWLLVAGLLKLGWVAQFLSAPIVTGFVAGLVVLIVVGEIPGLAGMPVPTGSLLERLAGLVRHLPDAHLATSYVGLASLAVLVLGQRFAPKLPWSLVVLVGAIAGSAQLDLADRGVQVVGTVPSGLPLPALPAVDITLWGGLITGGLAIAGVGIAEGLAAARTFGGGPTARPIRDDAELTANGVADLASGLFGGMAVGGSLSKTAANAKAGARTQVSSVTAALITLVVLALATGLLADLPRAALSAIVIHAVWGLVKPSAFVHYHRIRRNDLVAALVAFGGVLAVGPLNGLLLAVGQSLLGLVYRSMQVTVDEMGKVVGEKAAWGAVAHDAARQTFPGVIVLRPDGPLFWANATTVLDRVRELTVARPEVTALILDLEATNQLDTTTVEQIHQLLRALRDAGIEVYLVRVFTRVKLVLEAAGLLDELGPGKVWHSIAAGVKAAQAAVPLDDDAPEHIAVRHDHPPG